MQRNGKKPQIEVEELQLLTEIYFANIQEGFDKYHYVIVHWDEKNALDNLRKLWYENGEERSFLDFYYFEIGTDEREKVNSLLECAEIQYLECIEKDCEKGKMVFQLTEELLRIAVKLNAASGLFSTFYFTKNPVTLWGNYNEEYIIFTN